MEYRKSVHVVLHSMNPMPMCPILPTDSVHNSIGMLFRLNSEGVPTRIHGAFNTTGKHCKYIQIKCVFACFLAIFGKSMFVFYKLALRIVRIKMFRSCIYTDAGPTINYGRWRNINLAALESSSLSCTPFQEVFWHDHLRSTIHMQDIEHFLHWCIMELSCPC